MTQEKIQETNIENNKPVNYKLGMVQLTKWTNTNKEGTTYNTYEISKSFKKSDEDDWQTTKTLNYQDLLKLQILVNHIVEQNNIVKTQE